MSPIRSRLRLAVAALCAAVCLILALAAGPLAVGGQSLLLSPPANELIQALPPCAGTPEPGAVLVTFQQGADGYTGAEDTTLRLGSGNLSTAWYLHVGFRRQSSFLLRYDLSSIPAGSRVLCAAQRLYGEMWSGAPFELELGAFAVKRPWTLTEATYSLAASGVPWQTGGCNGPLDRRQVPEVTFTATQVQHWYELDVTRVVSEWVSGVTPNLGLSFQALDRFDEDSLWFTGSDDVTPEGFTGNRPILVVLYVPPAATPTATSVPAATPTPTATTVPPEPTATPTETPEGPPEPTATPTATPEGPPEPTATPTATP
ncbi:MAG TPA: DNRLRE domain-containing protein, partial [Anaerolineae bacterium]|nr:DNRLRE domain-containing protein [Anaerolineae bacterium]